MNFCSPTIALLSTLDGMSGNTLARRDDLGALLELGRGPLKRQELDELSFYAKFLFRAHGIMTRIGRNGEGYDRLAKAFGNALAKALSLSKSLVADGPEEVRNRFTENYFVLTPTGMENLLALFHDLSWYKNWLIDNERQRKAPV